MHYEINGNIKSLPYLVFIKFVENVYMSAVYNFSNQFEGNTFEPPPLSIKRFVNGTLVDFTGVVILFEVFRANSSRVYLSKTSSDAGISIVDSPNCIFQINKIPELSLTPFDYYYTINVTYPDGTIKNYMHGKLPVIKKSYQNVKHDC